MYKILTIKSRIRLPPELFDKDLKEAVEEVIAEEFESYLSNNVLLLSLVSIEEVGDGRIISGDGAVYYQTVFKMLAYTPELQEVVNGLVTEVAEFGAFARIGPIDGLIHITQIMDDYVNYSNSNVLSGKESNRTLKVGDDIIAKIIAVSLRNLQSAKIGLTMRQQGLGKPEWWVEKKEKAKAAPKKKTAKTKK